MKSNVALHLAAKAGDLDEIVKILEADQEKERGGPDILDQRDCTGWTALHWASSRGKDDIVTYLTEKGANVNATTSENWAPVHDGARNGSVEVLKALKAASAEMHIKTTNGNSPMHLACQYGREPAVHFITDCDGSDVNATNNFGFSPLHLAARHGHEAIVHFLVDKRANVLLQDRIGRSAQALAEASKHNSVVSVLEAASKEQRGNVINSAELALNAAEEALENNDKIKAKEKYEKAAEGFTMAGDAERAKLALEKSTSLRIAK